MERLFLRLIHFLIYTILLIYKFVEIGWVNFKDAMWYYAYFIYYWGNDDKMVMECCSKEALTAKGGSGDKKLTNIAIVINGLVRPEHIKSKPTAEELSRVSLSCQQFEIQISQSVIDATSEIVKWITSTQDIKVLSIFDKKGLLKEKSAEVQKCINNTLKESQNYKSVKVKNLNSNSFSLTIQSKSKNGQEQNKQKYIKINIISESDNFDQILNKIKSQSKKFKKNKMKELTKIEDYNMYEKSYYDLKQDAQVVDLLPQLVLVFNSPRRVLKMPGFPCLMKEIAEIIDCGQLCDHKRQTFKATQFIDAIGKYQKIEQRWGK